MPKFKECNLVSLTSAWLNDLAYSNSSTIGLFPRDNVNSFKLLNFSKLLKKSLKLVNALIDNYAFNLVVWGFLLSTSESDLM